MAKTISTTGPDCPFRECHVPRSLAQSCILAGRLAHLTDAELDAYLWALWAQAEGEVADA